MGDLMQVNEVVEKRASLLSTERFSLQDNEGARAPPKDKFFLMKILFFALGISGMVPMTFFLTATDYWMYKFRDVSQETYNANNKTFLQTNFASITSMLQSVPSALATILAAVFAHKLALRTRLLGTMIALTSAFIVFTIFVEINTDSWQLGFFIITMAVCISNTIFGVLFSISNFSILARFPPEFIMLHTYGSSMSGIIGAALQVFCLAVGGSSTQVALIYYLCGTTILLIATILIYVSEYLPLYQYYMKGIEEDVGRPMPSFADLKEVFKRMWMIIVPMVFTIPVMALSSPTITILIVSEDNGAWGKKYFMPVSTFLLREVTNLIGRFFARPILTRNNAKWFILLGLLQAFGLNPLFPLCNAKPRNHLPVLFPHDWQYILLTTINGLFTGYMMSVNFLSMPNLAGDKTEQGFQLFQTTLMILMSATSPLNQVWVNIL